MMEYFKKFVLDILNKYLKLEKAGKDYRVKCIYHSEYKPSLYISLDKMVYHCFGCGAKGKLVDLLKDLTRKSISELVFMDFLMSDNNKENDEIKKNVGSSCSDKVVEVSLDRFEKIREVDRVYLDYLAKRGLGLEEVEKFDLRKGVDEMLGRLVVPVYEKGVCVGYLGRAIFSGAPKWKYMQGFKASNYLFNLDNVKDEVVLVEGVFDVMRLEKEGVSAVGLFGKRVSDEQLEKLIEKRFKKVYVCLDGDVSDIELLTIYHRLTGWLDGEVKVLRLEAGKDPDDLGKKIFDYEVDLEFSL